jgi:hypothetical protein
VQHASEKQKSGSANAGRSVAGGGARASGKSSGEPSVSVSGPATAPKRAAEARTRGRRHVKRSAATDGRLPLLLAQRPLSLRDAARAGAGRRSTARGASASIAADVAAR